jgi:hypothetical protein
MHHASMTKNDMDAPPAGKTVRLGVRLLLGLLGAAFVSTAVFGVWPTVVGPSGLDVWRGAPTATPQAVPSVVVRPDAGFAERFPASGAEPQVMFPWTETASGTADAATGLPPVELAPWHSLELIFWAPTWPDRIGFAGPKLAEQAMVLVVLWLLWLVVRTVPAGEIFTPANARRMLTIGAVVALGGSAVQLLTYLAHRAIISRSAADGILEVAFSLSFLPLLAGAVILLLAEVFRQGVRLRADVDGLV